MITRNPASTAPGIRLIVVLLAHATENRLLGTTAEGAELLLGTMSNAPPTLDCHLVATFGFTSLAGRSMSAAEPSLLDILGTSRMVASLASSAMRDAKSTLHNAIMTTFYRAFATKTLAGSTSCQLGSRIPRGISRLVRNRFSGGCFSWWWSLDSGGRGGGGKSRTSA